jgi:hypothetical protein
MESSRKVQVASAQGMRPSLVAGLMLVPSLLFADNSVCRIDDRPVPPPAEAMYLYFVSLHHGVKAFDVPHKDDLERAGEYAKRSIPNPASSVIVIPAASCTADLAGRGYLGPPEPHFRSHLPGDWSTKEAALCGGKGRTAIIVGSNFSIVDGKQERYPDGLVGSEGVNYGIFEVLHKASGRHYMFVAGTVQHDDANLRREQILHLLQRGDELSARFPTFVGGDFNLTADSAEDDEARQYIRRSTIPLTIPLNAVCKPAVPGSPPYTHIVNTKVHFGLINVRGAEPVAVTGYILDPRAAQPLSSPGASSIRIADGSAGMVHAMTGALMNIGTCRNSAGQLTWSCAGAVPGQACVAIAEPSDPNNWHDNYLCAPADLGLRFSFAGRISGLRCTNITEASEPGSHTWSDNYLCTPRASRTSYRWSSTGPTGGRSRQCVQFLEPSDPDTWQDNFLCTEPCGAKDQICCDTDCNQGLACESGICHAPSGGCSALHTEVACQHNPNCRSCYYHCSAEFNVCRNKNQSCPQGGPTVCPN